MEEVMKSIETNLKMINLTCKTAPNIIENKRKNDLKRTLKQLEERRNDIRELKTQAQMHMFAEGKDEDEVLKYGEDLDEDIIYLPDPDPDPGPLKYRTSKIPDPINTGPYRKSGPYKN